MKRYIALLRGINVSGKNILKMSDLKLMLESLGFYNVTTYIQSGNIIFDTEKSELPLLIENQIKNNFGLSVPAIVIDSVEFEKIYLNNPYLNSVDKDKLYITFLDDEPTKDLISKIDKSIFLPDEFEIIGKAIYIKCPNGYGNTKITNTFFENKLKIKATTRNIKTSLKLIEIANK